MCLESYRNSWLGVKMKMPSSKKVPKDIELLCRCTACRLFRVYHGEKCGGCGELLVFPKKRGSKEKRISEQEARILLCKTVECHGGYRYSLEMPTKNKYKFSEVNYENKRENRLIVGKGQSGSIDLTLYDCRAGRKGPLRFNVEFKAHTAAEHEIHKDLLKLECENGQGVFFHVLENCNKGTLPGILGKCRAYSNVRHAMWAKNKNFILVIVVLKKKLFCIQKVDFSRIGKLSFNKWCECP